MRTLILLGTLISLLTLAGCENTIHGFGQDMENTGEKIQNSNDGNHH